MQSTPRSLAVAPLKYFLNLDHLFLSADKLLLLVILVKSLCGLEASCVPAEEVLSVSGESCDSSDEMDTKESVNGRSVSRKKKSKRHKGTCGRQPLLELCLGTFCVCDAGDCDLQVIHGVLRDVLQLVCAQRRVKTLLNLLGLSQRSCHFTKAGPWA